MKTSWNLELLFKSDKDPEIGKYLKQTEQAHKQFADKWQKRTDYLANPKVLRQALDDYEQLMRHYGGQNKALYYFWLRSELNEADPKIKARFNQVDQLTRQLINQIQFFELNLAKIKPSAQDQILKNPLLKDYRHFLQRLFDQSKYLLSEAEEKILTLKSSPAHHLWTKMSSSLMSQSERHGKNFSQIISILDHPDKKVRDAAAEDFNNILKQHLEVVENEINAILTNKRIDSNLRGYTRPEQGRFLADDIDAEVVDQLVQAVASRFDIPQRYYRLKAKLLGFPKLAYHERNMEYSRVEKKYPFDSAVKTVQTALAAVDDEFGQIFQNFFQQGQVDVAPRKAKRSGAFCAYGLITDPTYVLLNHTNKLNDVLTLAHEFGHAINDELMKKVQNSLNFGTPLSTAEVASTFMEDFVLEQILKSADDHQRLSIMMMKLNDDVSSIFRQIALFRFEQELHHAFKQSGYLSAKEIGFIFQKHMKSYMGPAVEQSPGSANWWTYISHFRSFFYVYSYASGLLISKSLQASVKSNPAFISQVKQFLSAGLSDSPKSIFADLGVDITDPKFWQKGLDETDKLLRETENLAKQLGLLKDR